MSMENELKRIADALEALGGMAIERQQGAPAPAKPKAKKKKAKTEDAPPADFGDAESAAELPGMSPMQLMAYCNAELTQIKNKDKRVQVIKKVVALFKEMFGVTSVKEVAEDRVMEAKEEFDRLMGEK